MTRVIRVVMLGFNSFDRAAITTGLRLHQRHSRRYEVVQGLDDGELLVADGDHAPAVQLVLVTERLPDTVFVGDTPPPDAAAAVPRPIDPQALVRALDALCAARLPPEAPAPSSERDRPAAPLPAPPAPHRAGTAAPTALVVDDSETARQALAARLERLGFDVELAAHSGQALARMARRRFNGVFIDVDLGLESAVDGFTLCQQIKRRVRADRGPPPWVALVTGLDAPSDRVRGTLAGCDAYLTKPLDEAELHHVLWREGWVQPLQDH